jgi:flagellar protein FliO/FliZ
MQTPVQIVINLTIFIVIIFLFVYVYKRFIATNKLFTRRSKYIEQVDKYYLANDKWIEIVKLGDKYLLLGISQNNINEIREVTQEDLHELKTEENENVFKTILQKNIKKQE